MPALAHGFSRGSPLQRKVYRAWAKMKDRCHNPFCAQYVWYGAKGIRVCDEWRQTFEAFFQHVGLPPTLNHSIDRFPNTKGNYEPNNVRWATVAQQNATIERKGLKPLVRRSNEREILRLAASRFSTRQIAAKLKISKSYVHKIIKNAAHANT